MERFDLERHWPWLVIAIAVADSLVVYRVARRLGARAEEAGRSRLAKRTLPWSIPATWRAVAVLLWSDMG